MSTREVSLQSDFSCALPVHSKPIENFQKQKIAGFCQSELEAKMLIEPFGEVRDPHQDF